jgi:hypothetical protein
MLNAHTLIKSMVSHGLAESVAEDIVNNLASEERVNKLEESMIKPSEFKEAINKLDSRMNEFSKDLRHDIAELRSELKLDISKTKNEILYWMIPFFLTNIGLIAAVLLRILAK